MTSTQPKADAARLGVVRWLAQMRLETRGSFTWILGFSLVANLLLLVAPLYMIQIYDRVLTSASIDTLLWLTLVAVFLLSVYGAAEAGRRRVCALAGARIEARLARRIFQRFEDDPSATAGVANDLAHVGRIQSVFQNGLVLPFFDAPFTPMFLGLMFLVHPTLGLLGLGGAATIFTVAVAAEWTTRRSSSLASTLGTQAQDFAQGLDRQRSVIVAMGLTPRVFERWSAVKAKGRGFGLSASKRDAAFAASARSTRQIVQILILGAGAALAISQQISPGAIVAASIILSRALAPIDQIVGGWRGLTQARRAWIETMARVGAAAEPSRFMGLPRPEPRLQLDRLAVATPGSRAALIRPFSFEAGSGDCVALVGANGGGKTTLLQTLAGSWPTAGGSVVLGGRNLHGWPSADRGDHIGYVPQDVELLPATAAENIARLTPAAPDEVVAAARKAGAHDTILGLPDGYDTLIGPGGAHISAGQRQLIGLARAFFREPVLLLLDEPTAHLDQLASGVLRASLSQEAQRGAIIVIATHDRALIRACSTILVVRRGGVMAASAEQYLNSLDDGGADAPSPSAHAIHALGGAS